MFRTSILCFLVALVGAVLAFGGVVPGAIALGELVFAGFSLLALLAGAAALLAP